MSLAPGLAIAIGNFDGVHLGHKRLLQAARETEFEPAVLMFNPHPACIVAPERAPKLLTSIEQRSELIREQGIEKILVLPFTAELACLTPEEFAQQFLHDKFDARVVVVGENFRFGHKQAGDVRSLAELGSRLGFRVQALPIVTYRQIRVSSGEIRKRIMEGDVSFACRLLGRPYSIAGDVVSGRGVGAKQTVPTLNLRTNAQVLPARGVYITRTYADGRRWNSITNIGYRPTFGDTPDLSIETFLLEPLEGDTPGNIRLDFLRRVRDEKKFDSPEALRAQILRDVRRAQVYFRRIK